MTGTKQDLTGATLARASRDAATAGAEDAAARLALRADDAGLVDVAYARSDSPLGPLFVAATSRGLVRVAYAGHQDEDALVAELANAISPRALESPARLDSVRRELDEYFSGRRQRFEHPLDWRLTRGFNRSVLRATARIGYGRTSTYAELARRAGSPRASRAAGNALNRNPLPIVVPCHRVLRTGGALGGYGGGLPAKEYLLRLEGAVPAVVGDGASAESPRDAGVLGR
jgi:methylated-DNA-[protein]-cysteine S-methyltransferase